VNRKKLIVYAAIPAGILAILMGMYFSGIRLLETIVVMPYMESVAPNSRREFGLMEFVEHSIILAAMVVAIRAAIRVRPALLRGMFALIALAVLVLFLEEVDYGLHYYEYLRGIHPDEAATARNLHNVGDRTSQLKHLGDFAMGLAFVCAVLPLRRAKSAWVRFFAPDRYLALTLIIGMLTHVIAHSLNDRGLGVGIRSNISEFREIVTFYFGLMYTLELYRRAREESPIPTSEPAPLVPNPKAPQAAG
jgi:hypothetical protein